jgi:hypothetical protein
MLYRENLHLHVREAAHVVASVRLIHDPKVVATYLGGKER